MGEAVSSGGGDDKGGRAKAWAQALTLSQV